MIWNIKAAENLIAGDFVEFTADWTGTLSCKKALEPASISAIAARDVGNFIRVEVDADALTLLGNNSKLLF